MVTSLPPASDLSQPGIKRTESTPAKSPQQGAIDNSSSASPVESIRVQIRRQSNAAILQASQQVSLQSGNEPLALLYSAAIDAINEKLAPELGENALQRGIDEGVDVSPQATADRIVSLTTALFGRYQDSNTELSFEDQVNRFVEVISQGIEQGFNEARDILDGLGVLEGDIAADIDTTFELVQLGLQEFSDRQLGLTVEPEPAAAN